VSDGPPTWAIRWEALLEFADTIGWTVRRVPRGRSDSADPVARRIDVQRGLPARAKVFTLLHELGHALHWAASEPALFRTGPVADLESELDAWARGWLLAERLDLRVDVDDYRRYAARFLRGYAAACAPRRRKRP
jgi:hypothetical protein